jgi:hypothetical protein
VSRFGDGDYEPIIGSDGKVKDTSGLWRSNVKRALAGKRGQAALRDLRDALLALPEKRLIEGALCTVGLSEKIEAMPVRIPTPPDSLARTVDGLTDMTNWHRMSLIEFVEEHEDQPEGVCAIGAYVWWQKVKAGMDPADAFAALPVLPDTDGGEWETAQAGQDAGLTAALAWDLAYTNDERLQGLTPEARYAWFMEWIDKQLAVPA